MMLAGLYLLMTACFMLGRIYEGQRQDALRQRGTTYRLRGFWTWRYKEPRRGSGRSTRRY